jgi:D-sedoheptulose 7-phosphate isomerase
MTGGDADDRGSAYDRLFYPYLFAGGTASSAEVLAQVRASTLAKCAEVVALRRALLARHGDMIVAAGQALAAAFRAGATLLAFGNGGSTTDAADLVADLLDPPAGRARPLPAIDLSAEASILTAVGNDVGFDNIFTRQVIAYGRAGDIAVGISTSGNSANVLVALEQAKKQRLLTVALLGYDGGKIARSASVDYAIVVASDHIPRIQEAQATAYHALLEVVWTCVSPE